MSCDAKDALGAVFICILMGCPTSRLRLGPVFYICSLVTFIFAHFVSASLCNMAFIPTALTVHYLAHILGLLHEAPELL